MKKILSSLLLAVAIIAAYLYNSSETVVASTEKTTAVNMEIPAVPDEGIVVHHTGFALAYSPVTNCPQWVAWSLTREEAESNKFKRKDNFRADPSLPHQNQVQGSDYRHTGFDKGHMCPAADMKWSEEAMDDCFYMSNICPQEPNLNQKWWEHLEQACRRWAGMEGEIFICCGPIFSDEIPKRYIGTDVLVRVPDGFFKVVLSLSPGREKAIGFIYRNDSTRQTMEDAVVTVDKAEEITGYDFFPALDDDLENRIEAVANLRSWD